MIASYKPSKKAADMQLSFFSPAKINLFFRVIEKRSDGFHEIASLYQAIGLCDVLQVARSEEDFFTCSDVSLPMDESNLVCKALALFRKKTGVLDPIRIHLEKKIPVQAGLGGGSSNAATALWAFFQLFSLFPDLGLLLEMGSAIGSDVSFFFSKGTAYCTGRGEKLEEILLPEGALPSEVWIAKPSVGLSTPLVYGCCKPAELPQKDPKKSLVSLIEGEEFSLYNDLEVAAFSLCPDLHRLKEKLLESGFDQVVMTGSGTAFFCFGTSVPPLIEGVRFFKVPFLRRETSRWYEL